MRFRSADWLSGPRGWASRQSTRANTPLLAARASRSRGSNANATIERLVSPSFIALHVAPRRVWGSIASALTRSGSPVLEAVQLALPSVLLKTPLSVPPYGVTRRRPWLELGIDSQRLDAGTARGSG